MHTEMKLITEQKNCMPPIFFDNDPELEPRSKIRKWKDTCEAQMKIFLRLLILLGIIRKLSLGLHFSRRYITKTSFFHETIKGAGLEYSLGFCSSETI